MRRHAKASTAGSNQRQAKGLGRIFRGALATRGASLEAKGSSAPRGGRCLLPAGALAALVALMAFAAPASASKTHLFKETFGSAAQPSFSAPHGIAIDQSSGDLLVMDAGNSTIRRYNPDGTPDTFSATGTAVIDGVGIGDETPQGGLGFASSAESQIAVDNSGTATDGNIYVTQGFPNLINVFAKTGAYLGQLSESSGGPFAEACGVAVDPAGAVYVGDYTGGIHKFTPAANPPVNGDYTATFNSVSVPCALAAGAGSTAGFLFAARYSGPISKLDSSTGEPKYEVSPDSHTTLTVNPADGHVYGATGDTIKEFDASGALSATQLSATPTGNEVLGIAVSQASGELYVSRNVVNSLQVFAAPIVTVPDVTTTAATNNSGTKATLNGTVNPDGVELSECFFEWGETSSFGQSVPCAETPAAIGSGTSPVAVHADISGLKPNGNFYNFRLVAKNPAATANGSNQGFQTPDTVITTAATAISSSAATLNGTVNPDGVAITECVFEWGTTTNYGQLAPCMPNAGGIGTGTSPVPVHADLSGLDVGVVYHYRLKAANANGPILGEDETLQTLGPVIAGVWADEVDFIEAMLKAEVNPAGVATTAHFEWGTTSAYGNESAESAVGSDSENHQLSVFLDGLKPNTTYHYRLVATNADGVSESADHAFTTPAPFVPQANCPNQQFRTGVGANLPDCRAYEMVSPVDKGGRGIVAATTQPSGSIRAAFDQAAVGGDAITFTSATSFGDEPSNRNANQYLARRGESGWSTHGISAPLGTSLLKGFPSVSGWAFDTQFQSFSDDLSTAWLRDANATPLTPDAQEGFANIYRRDSTDGSYHDPVITSTPLFWQEGSEDWGPILATGVGDLDLRLKGRSRDGSHVIFQAAAQLTADGSANLAEQIYDYANGELHLVSVLPGGGANPEDSFVGTAFHAALMATGQARAVVDRAVSEDGSRIFWTGVDEVGRGSGPGAVYVRVDGQTTVRVSESVTTKESRFETASTDGSRAVFSFDPDDVGGSAEELYEFDVDTETPTLIAHNVTSMVGAGEDLSKLYFVSREALDAGAIAGEENLYLRDNGTIGFIATLAVKDVFPGGGPEGAFGAPSISGRSGGESREVNPSARGVRVTPDGSHLAFMSRASLTGYDNTDAADGKADVEVFLYDATADDLTCVSCNPTGARPHGGGTRTPAYQLGRPEVLASPWRTAAWIPPSEQELNTSQVLSDDGNRIFFNALDALALHDTNGVQDVYQWEAQGTGSCQKAGGCISLISTGKNSTYSEFIDASADGRDVFIRTESSIDARDTDLIDIYNARVGGGFPPPPPPPAPCAGDACQSAPPPPTDPTPASAAFRGAGDPKPKKAKRRCRARSRQANKPHASKRQAKKKAKACGRAKRGAGR